MAKRRKTTAITTFSPRAYTPAAPIIRIAAPRVVAPKRRATRRAPSAVGGGNLKDSMIKMAIGGAALGFIEKSGFAASLPTIPLVGRKGTIAIAAYFLGGKKPGLMRDVAIAAAVLSGYELGKEGKISGEDDVSGDDE